MNVSGSSRGMGNPINVGRLDHKNHDHGRLEENQELAMNDVQHLSGSSSSLGSAEGAEASEDLDSDEVSGTSTMSNDSVRSRERLLVQGIQLRIRGLLAEWSPMLHESVLWLCCGGSLSSTSNQSEGSGDIRNTSGYSRRKAASPQSSQNSALDHAREVSGREVQRSVAAMNQMTNGTLRSTTGDSTTVDTTFKVITANSSMEGITSKSDSRSKAKFLLGWL